MTQTVFPTLTYADAHAAIEWLERALGAERVAVHPGEGDRAVAHAEVRVAGGIVMLGSTRGDDLVSRPGTVSTYLVMSDPDAAFARARDAGAEVVAEPFDTDYGSRDFTLRDPEGNVWHVGTYAPA